MDGVIGHFLDHGTYHDDPHLIAFVDAISKGSSVNQFVTALARGSKCDTLFVSRTMHDAFLSLLKENFESCGSQWHPCACASVVESAHNGQLHLILTDRRESGDQQQQQQVVCEKLNLGRACAAFLHTLASPAWHRRVTSYRQVPYAVAYALWYAGAGAHRYLCDTILANARDFQTAEFHFDMFTPCEFGCAHQQPVPRRASPTPEVLTALEALQREDLDQAALQMACATYLYSTHRLIETRNYAQILTKNDRNRQLMSDPRVMFSYFCSMLGVVTCKTLHNYSDTQSTRGNHGHIMSSNVGRRGREFVDESQWFFHHMRQVADEVRHFLLDHVYDERTGRGGDRGGDERTAESAKSARNHADIWSRSWEMATQTRAYLKKVHRRNNAARMRWSAHAVQIVPVLKLIEYLQMRMLFCEADRVDRYSCGCYSTCYALRIPKHVDSVTVTRTLQVLRAREPALKSGRYLLFEALDHCYLVMDIAQLHATQTVAAFQLARAQGTHQPARQLFYPLLLQVTLAKRSLHKSRMLPDAIAYRSMITTVGTMLFRDNDKFVSRSILACDDPFFHVYRLFPRVAALWPTVAEQLHVFRHAWTRLEESRLADLDETAKVRVRHSLHRKRDIHASKAEHDADRDSEGEEEEEDEEEPMGKRRCRPPHMSDADVHKDWEDPDDEWDERYHIPDNKFVSILTALSGFLFLRSEHMITQYATTHLVGAFQCQGFFKDSTTRVELRRRFPNVAAYAQVMFKKCANQHKWRNRQQHRIRLDTADFRQVAADIEPESDRVVALVSELYMVALSGLLGFYGSRIILLGLYCPSIEASRVSSSRKRVVKLPVENRAPLYEEYNANFMRPFPTREQIRAALENGQAIGDANYWRLLQCNLRFDFTPSTPMAPIASLLRILEWSSLQRRAFVDDGRDLEKRATQLSDHILESHDLTGNPTAAAAVRDEARRTVLSSMAPIACGVAGPCEFQPIEAFAMGFAQARVQYTDECTRDCAYNSRSLDSPDGGPDGIPDGRHDGSPGSSSSDCVDAGSDGGWASRSADSVGSAEEEYSDEEVSPQDVMQMSEEQFQKLCEKVALPPQSMLAVGDGTYLETSLVLLDTNTRPHGPSTVVHSRVSSNAGDSSGSDDEGDVHTPTPPSCDAFRPIAQIGVEFCELFLTAKIQNPRHGGKTLRALLEANEALFRDLGTYTNRLTASPSESNERITQQHHFDTTSGFLPMRGRDNLALRDLLRRLRE